VTGHQPGCKREGRQREDDRDEDARDAVGEVLHRRLRGLRGLDEARHLRECRVGTDARRRHDEAAGGVDRRAEHLCTRPDLDGHGLTGEHRDVNRAHTFGDPAVGGDLLAWPHDEAVADLETRDGDLVTVLQSRGLRSELQQRAHRVRAPTARSCFQVAAEQDQRDDHRGRLEIHLAVGEEQERDDRPRPRGDRADRHECVHRHRAVTCVHERRAMEHPP
jgi:hypothetical protein